jgi:hypothetical protein
MQPRAIAGKQEEAINRVSHCDFNIFLFNLI